MPRERKQVGLRLPDDLHDQVTEAARAADISVNRWITTVVSDALDVRSAWVLDARDRAKRVVEAHTDRYPIIRGETEPVTSGAGTVRGSLVTEIQHEPVIQPGSNMCACGLPVRDEGVHPDNRPVGSFDPDTDQPA